MYYKTIASFFGFLPLDHVLISLILCIRLLSIVLCRRPTKNFKALCIKRESDSGSLSYACITGTIAMANKTIELYGMCLASPVSLAQRYKAYSVCGIKKSASSFRLLARSNSTPSPATNPAAAGIHDDNGGGRRWRFRRKQIPYLASITTVAMKAVDQTTLRIRVLRTNFGLKM